MARGLVLSHVSIETGLTRTGVLAWHFTLRPIRSSPPLAIRIPRSSGKVKAGRAEVEVGIRVCFGSVIWRWAGSPAFGILN
jgi:hypothetical protein